MTARIVLFGATGYTGEPAARAMVERGLRPVLAGRRREPLERLAAELGGLEIRIADAQDPGAVRALVGRGDVLVSTVGPFAKWGEPALRAAIAAGATYLDSTGESPFIRRVFEEFGPVAAANGAALFTAFGYDFVPGNLAGALALNEAGTRATAVHVGYYVTGQGRTIADAAQSLGISPWTMSRWVKAAKTEGAEAFRGQGQRTAEQQELYELRQRVRQLEEERAILKKAAAYFARDVR